jgi:hypothetical protein
MDREKEIAEIKIALTKYINENIPGYEVHLFDREKQINRREQLEKKLPRHDHSSRIKKSNAWIVWLCDENQYITDLQVYDFDLESGPYRREKITEYVSYIMKITPYRDCGCVNSDWDQWDITDVFFKFGFQNGFHDRKIMLKCLKRLACINEFRERILKYLTYLE